MVTKFNRFEAVSALRSIAKKLKDAPDAEVSNEAANITKSAKETSAMYEVVSELFKCVDTSRLRKIGESSKRSFALRKIIGDGKAFEKAADVLDYSEQIATLTWKMASAFAKDVELAKQTALCVRRHTANAVNGLCDIMERKDFESPDSVFNANDNFAELEAEAKVAIKNSFKEHNWYSKTAAYDVLLKAYQFCEANEIAERLVKEVEAEAVTEEKSETQTE